MQIGEYVKPAGNYLKGSDILENPIAKFTIKTEGDLVVSEKFGGSRLHLLGEFNGEEKTFDCSKTNARFIAEKLGVDTINWVGKNLVLETYRTKTSEGKMVDAINVKEVE